MTLDVIILAGGRGSRMGGLDKAQVCVDGRRLIDVLLDTLPHPARVAVVTSRPISLRPGVTVVAEDPPFSGPVAAINAGCLALASNASEYTGVLAVDAPASASLLPVLLASLSRSPEASVALVEGEPLCAVWRSSSLQRELAALPTVDNRAAKSLFYNVPVEIIPGNGQEKDYDTLDELSTVGNVTVDN